MCVDYDEAMKQDNERLNTSLILFLKALKASSLKFFTRRFKVHWHYYFLENHPLALCRHFFSKEIFCLMLHSC
jgi:hypothetical protein